MEGGRSNLTYQITDGQRQWVLRRPPLGLIAPTANDIGREYRVIAALSSTPVPVPQAIAYCDDAAVIGSPFSITSMVQGRIIRTPADAMKLSSSEASGAAEALVNGLAAIHNVPFQEIGLESLGRPDGFVNWQIQRWRKQWGIVSTRPFPAITELYMRLFKAAPARSEVRIVHGDYRIDNVMFDNNDAGCDT
jgi:aminoglycoside phosphotransferase (APT) family kinase protein